MKRNKLIDKEEPFVFSSENIDKLNSAIAKYPKGRQASAVMFALDLAQRQNAGWVSREAVEVIALFLDMHAIKVWEVASFYTMYNLTPPGKNHIQVCRTTSCWLRGSDDILKVCQKKAAEIGQNSGDGKFSLVEVECLGACVNAPVVQINDDYYEDLDPEKMEEIIDKLQDGKEIKSGPQVDRLNSAPLGGAKILKK